MSFYKEEKLDRKRTVTGKTLITLFLVLFPLFEVGFFFIKLLKREWFNDKAKMWRTRITPVSKPQLNVTFFAVEPLFCPL